MLINSLGARGYAIMCVPATIVSARTRVLRDNAYFTVVRLRDTCATLVSALQVDLVYIYLL